MPPCNMTGSRLVTQFSTCQHGDEVSVDWFRLFPTQKQSYGRLRKSIAGPWRHRRARCSVTERGVDVPRLSREQRIRRFLRLATYLPGLMIHHPALRSARQEKLQRCGGFWFADRG